MNIAGLYVNQHMCKNVSSLFESGLYCVVGRITGSYVNLVVKCNNYKNNIGLLNE